MNGTVPATNFLLFGDAGFVVVLVVVLLGVVIFMIFAWLAERKRREELAQMAAKLGWTYQPGKNKALISRWPQIDLFRQGNNRYAENVMTGQSEGLPFALFDFHYETYTHDKNGRKTHHHWHTCCVMTVPVAFPHELKVRPEGFFDKFKSMVGFSDINFESAEFSRRFHVTSNDRKFAYDVIHPRMMEYLLANPRLSFEMEGHILMVTGGGGKQPAGVWVAFQKSAAEIVRQLPDYLISQFGQGAGGT